MSNKQIPQERWIEFLATRHSNKGRIKVSFLSLIAIALFVSACNKDTVAQAPDLPTEDSNSESLMNVDPSLFSEQGLVKNITEEPCTLSEGTETTCYRITTVTVKPSDHQAGPWCPSNLTDTAEEGGIWLEDGQVYDVDGNFIENLDNSIMMTSGSYTETMVL